MSVLELEHVRLACVRIYIPERGRPFVSKYMLQLFHCEALLSLAYILTISPRFTVGAPRN